MAEPVWAVRLSSAAETDFSDILTWTAAKFGARQARVYQATLVEAVAELTNGPDLVGSKRLDLVMPGLRTLHVTAVADDISFCIAPLKRAKVSPGLSKWAGFYMIRWMWVAIRRHQKTLRSSSVKA